ncbi:MAG: RidA family protein [Methylophilaceae bacterium]|nr:RidA family protein [Methylophilaceae bacterium]
MTVVSSPDAPQAIGPYSQAIQVGAWVFLSGQIGLDPKTGQLCSDEIEQQAEQIFRNLSAVCQAAGGGLAQLCKINIYLKDMNDFELVNRVMQRYVTAPYPARATVAVLDLPKGAKIEIDGVMVLA